MTHVSDRCSASQAQFALIRHVVEDAEFAFEQDNRFTKLGGFDITSDRGDDTVYVRSAVRHVDADDTARDYDGTVRGVDIDLGFEDQSLLDIFNAVDCGSDPNKRAAGQPSVATQSRAKFVHVG